VTANLVAAYTKISRRITKLFSRPSPSQRIKSFKTQRNYFLHAIPFNSRQHALSEFSVFRSPELIRIATRRYYRELQHLHVCKKEAQPRQKQTGLSPPENLTLSLRALDPHWLPSPCIAILRKSNQSGVLSHCPSLLREIELSPQLGFSQDPLRRTGLGGVL
jgi:hypothetical protein